MSPVLGRPPRAPRSCPVKPGATAHGVRKNTTVTGKPTGAPRATRPDEAQRTDAGPRGTPERHAAGQNHGTGPCAKQQGPAGTANHTTTAQEAVHSNTQPGEECPPKRTQAARGAPGGSGEAQRRGPGRGRGRAGKRRRGHGAPERPNTSDRVIRDGRSSTSRRPPDCSNRVQAPRTRASGAEQAGGGAAPRTGSSGDTWRRMPKTASSGAEQAAGASGDKRRKTLRTGMSGEKKEGAATTPGQDHPGKRSRTHRAGSSEAEQAARAPTPRTGPDAAQRTLPRRSRDKGQRTRPRGCRGARLWRVRGEAGQQARE